MKDAFISAGILVVFTGVAFPSVKTYAIVHSDYDSAVVHAEEIKKEAPAFGLTALTKQAKMNESIVPGAQMFIIPLDAYYGVRNNEPVKDLDTMGRKYKIPGGCGAHKVPGPGYPDADPSSSQNP